MDEKKRKIRTTQVQRGGGVFPLFLCVFPKTKTKKYDKTDQFVRKNLTFWKILFVKETSHEIYKENTT